MQPMQKITFTSRSGQPHPFEEACEAIRKRDGLTRTEALTRARKEAPTAFESWQREGTVVDHYLSKISVKKVPSQVWRDFDRRVNEIVSEQKVRRTDAMEIVRKTLSPAEWDALQAGE